MVGLSGIVSDCSQIRLKKLTKAVLKNEPSLERNAVNESDHLGSTVVDVDAVETARIEVTNGNRETSAHQDRVIGNFSEIALTTKAVGGIGMRSLRC